MLVNSTIKQKVDIDLKEVLFELIKSRKQAIEKDGKYYMVRIEDENRKSEETFLIETTKDYYEFYTSLYAFFNVLKKNPDFVK